MKKIFLIVITLICLANLANGQDTLGMDLKKLARLKAHCDIYGGGLLKANLNYPQSEGDSICYRYMALINKIKKSQKIYLNYINKALKNKSVSLTKEANLYKNPGLAVQMDYDQYYIKTIDLYRVIKYSLFERNEDVLPEDFYNLKLIDIKNYYGYYEPEPKLKKAVKFILNNFSLTHQEVAFIKNKLNVKQVMDIKNFLDTNGMDEDNKKFIKEAISRFVNSRGKSLAVLHWEYKLSQDNQNYVPRDRDIQ